jgi:hypothetical protein
VRNLRRNGLGRTGVKHDIECGVALHHEAQLSEPHDDPSPATCGNTVSPAQACRHGVLVPLGAGSNRGETFGQFGPVAQRTFERRTESQCPGLGIEYPPSEQKGRAVANVLAMTARELGYPVTFRITVIAGNRSLHETTISTRPFPKAKCAERQRRMRIEDLTS